MRSRIFYPQKWARSRRIGSDVTLCVPLQTTLRSSVVSKNGTAEEIEEGPRRGARRNSSFGHHRSLNSFHRRALMRASDECGKFQSEWQKSASARAEPNASVRVISGFIAA